MKKFGIGVIIVTGVVLTVLAVNNKNKSNQATSNSFSLTPTKNNKLDQQATNNKPSSKSNNTQPVQKGPTMKTLTDFPQIEATQATLATNKGEITFKLFRDKTPLTTANFLNLAQEGFYDGVVFHRAIEDFMAQVGDPKSKNPSLKSQWGTGGPGYTIKDEFDSALSHDKKGMVSMANSGPNTGGSQFFITHKATPWLDNKHAVFGQVIEGLDVLDKIEIGDKIKEVTYQ